VIDNTACNKIDDMLLLSVYTGKSYKHGGQWRECLNY